MAIGGAHECRACRTAEAIVKRVVRAVRENTCETGIITTDCEGDELGICGEAVELPSLSDVVRIGLVQVVGLSATTGSEDWNTESLTGRHVVGVGLGRPVTATTGDVVVERALSRTERVTECDVVRERLDIEVLHGVANVVSRADTPHRKPILTVWRILEYAADPGLLHHFPAQRPVAVG